MSPPEPRLLQRVEEAAGAILAGEVVAFPTETSYGLAAAWDLPRPLELIFQMKGRPAGKPLLLLLAHGGQLPMVTSAVPLAARPLMERFWPGPLSLLLPARPGLPWALTGSTGRVGVRISSHPLALELTARVGRPITATSANRAGLPPALSPQEVAEQLGPAGLSLIMDGGTLPPSPPSTIVDVTASPPRLVREGRVEWREIEEALAPLR